MLRGMQSLSAAEESYNNVILNSQLNNKDYVGT